MNSVCREMTFQYPLQMFVDHLNADPIGHWRKVKSLTGTLMAHIEGKRLISDDAIQYRVNELLRYTVLMPISVPLNENICFTRATKFDGSEAGQCYKRVSRLSYLPREHQNSPAIGRLNKVGERLFYCCWDVYQDSLLTALAEIRVSDGDIANILISHTKASNSTRREEQYLHVAPLGINDYFRRQADLPFILHDTYRQHYEFLVQHLRANALRAMHDCDRFLVQVLGMQEVANLYKVTSEIAHNCLNSPILDGLIYPSTRFIGFPNVAMKIGSVDAKLQHVGAKSVEVKQGGIGYKTLYNGCIEGEEITWIPM